MRGIGLSVIFGLGTALVLSGCQTVVPVAGPALGTAGFAYGGGRGTQEFVAPAAAVHAAIAAGMNDLGVEAVRQRHDGPARIFEGSTRDGRPVVVTYRPGNGAARVTARIGLFGDPPFSKALMERIGVRLGTLPPAAIPEEPPSAPASNPFFSRRAVPDALMFREQAEAHYRDSPVPWD